VCILRSKGTRESKNQIILLGGQNIPSKNINLGVLSIPSIIKSLPKIESSMLKWHRGNS
jgi:hypothetical protein